MLLRASILAALMTSPAQAMMGGMFMGCGRVILLEADNHPFDVVFRATARDFREAYTEYRNTLDLFDFATHEFGDRLQSAFPMEDMFLDIRLNLHGLAITLARFQRIELAEGRAVAMSAVDLPSAQKAMTYFLRRLSLAKDIKTGDAEWNRDREAFLHQRSQFRFTLVQFRHLLQFSRQIEKTRLMIVVGETLQGHPLIASPFSEWEARLLGGRGELDESAKTLDDRERLLAEYLVDESYGVTALAEDTSKRNADVLLTHVTGLPVELKSLDPGADNTRVRNRVQDSLKRGGQARHIVIDARRSGLTYEEAVRSGFRVGGLLKARAGHLERLQELRIVGESYDLLITYLSDVEFAEQLERSAQSRRFQVVYDERMQDAKNRMDAKFIADFLRRAH